MEYRRVIRRIYRSLDDRSSGAGRKSMTHEVVTVLPLSLQREEEVASLYITRIDAGACERRMGWPPAGDQQSLRPLPDVRHG
jgi:hypothetical protein